MKILLITPPLTQLNTAYPATAQLLGFLLSRGIDAAQSDLSIELTKKIFSKVHLTEIFESIATKNGLSKAHKIMLQQADFYLQTIEPVMQFLAGRDSTQAVRFSNTDFWTASKRFPSDEDLEWAFGTVGNHDRATHLCTLFLKDISDLIQKTIDPHFELIRYAESLCLHLPDFEPLQQELEKPYSLIDKLLIEIFAGKIQRLQPEYVGFTIPFPGNLYSALRCAQWLRNNFPQIKIIVGGGYVNTELRQLADPKLFDYTDFLTFDDGELPLLRILQGQEMIRTLYRDDENKIRRVNFDSKENIKFAETGTLNYNGLTGNNYINTIELTNPMHALWSNGRWNKMMLSHGCYWAKCTFCDGSLDYIGRYEKVPVELLVDRMEEIMHQTGQSGFHFVDEAASPAVLRKLSEEIIRRKLVISYWTNIRFEKSFTPELCYLLAQSGCIAVSGGLEVASPRVLALINKGITIEIARQSMKNLAEAGIMTHAYLMYGFPTETTKETIESLEVVRDLFANGWLQSAFWHRYAMTIHSPSGINPASVGAKSLQTQPNSFANNEIPFTTPTEIDLDFYGKGLKLATYNYMQGIGYDVPVKKWF
ncbi:MAG: radical SAM protein [Paludibacter sp.]|nr:radical SAM protein [Paludibacter sp.]